MISTRTALNAPSPISFGEDMTSTTNNLQRLSAIEGNIVEQVVLDHLATNDSIHRRFFATCHRSTVTRTTSRLCDSGWLAEAMLIYPRKYFLPGPLAVSAYGIPQQRQNPLGPQSLPTEYALLEYTGANAADVTRVTPDGLKSRFPWYRPEDMAAPHCMRTTHEQRMLELVRVDLGGPADLVARKCRDAIQARRSAAEFEKLMQSRRFSIVIITATSSKAIAIEAALANHIWPDGLVFRINAFPSLISILPRSL